MWQGSRSPQVSHRLADQVSSHRPVSGSRAMAAFSIGPMQLEPGPLAAGRCRPLSDGAWARSGIGPPRRSGRSGSLRFAAPWKPRPSALSWAPTILPVVCVASSSRPQQEPAVPVGHGVGVDGPEARAGAHQRLSCRRERPARCGRCGGADALGARVGAPSTVAAKSGAVRWPRSGQPTAPRAHPCRRGQPTEGGRAWRPLGGPRSPRATDSVKRGTQ